MKIRDRIKDFRRVKASELLPCPRNWRKHPEAQQNALRNILAEVGIADVLLVRETPNGLMLIDGHLRAEMDGDVEWPVAVLDVTEKEADLLLASVDPIAEMAEPDPEKLAELLAEIDVKSEELKALLEAKAGVNAEPVEGLTDPDEVPEAPNEPVTQPGDLWILGEHRLLCGDSTKAEDVARVMNGERAGLMNTDPPYGVKLDLRANHEASNAAKGIDKTYREFDSIENDELNGEELQAFLEASIRSAVPHLVGNAAFYLWHPMLTQGTFFAAAAAADILIHRQIIWVKPHFIFGRGDYHWQHELCFYGWVKGNRPEFYGERNQSTTWVLDEGGGSIRKDQGHPTQKPVELFVRPITNHTKKGDVIYEPFAGSGSQYIAAEQHGRRCFGIEISPHYCDVIVQRWEAFTGKQAVLEKRGT